jgi:type II secretory ATPase GspE/PulE/Tfp pilus assembly ATPase PilB-like protein
MMFKMAEKTDSRNGIEIPKPLSTTIADFGKKIQDLNEENASASDFLETIISESLSLNSSDIHFETEEQATRLRVRVDGVLKDVTDIEEDSYNLILNRIKLLGDLKLNIRDIAQDGRFTVREADGAVDIEVRVSVNPSEFGETAVLRLLNPETISLNVSDLGLRGDDESLVEEELKRPNGMILVTGPTGSGKTTTLYAFLKKVSNPDIKIITIEDPIEYHLSGIEQTQVDESAGYDFKNGLRSILRQDPDVILVGEIRDEETAEIALHSSLTGHLVFSTLHTNSAVGAVPRLLDLGVKPSVIGPALNIVISQRLVRKLCENCREAFKPSEDLREKIQAFLAGLPEKVKKPDLEEIVLYKAVGCEKCNGTGYKGRVGIFEFLKLDKEFAAIITENVTEIDIEKAAILRGFVGSQADGLLKALKGVTSLEEVERQTGPLSWKTV